MGEEDIFDEKKSDVTFTDKKKDYFQPEKTSHRTQLLIGLTIFVVVGVLIALAITGLIDVFEQPEVEFGNSIQEPQENKPVIIQKESEGEVSSAFGEGEVNGYYLITTQDSWYGDYIDGRQIPSKINLDKDSKVNFRCFEDKHLGTSIYFGTFRNNIMNNLEVEVFIDGMLVQQKSTGGNQALIVEGSCYSHQPIISTERIKVETTETTKPNIPDVVTINVTGDN